MLEVNIKLIKLINQISIFNLKNSKYSIYNSIQMACYPSLLSNYEKDLELNPRFYYTMDVNMRNNSFKYMSTS